MKILSMAWTIYDSRLPMFSNNYTGGGLMIKNICEYIGRLQDSYLFLGKVKIPETELGNIHIIGTDNYPDAADVCCDANENHLRTMTNAFSDAVETIKPDIVNFHGSGILMQRCIAVCIKKNIPYVYTDHLFIGNDREIAGYGMVTKWENDIYNIPNINVITVGTGMKKRILLNYPNILPENIVVIKNGTNFIAEWKDGNIQTKYCLVNKKVLLCVGTINHRKNQCQIVNAFELLPACIRNKIKIIFCGKDGMNGQLQRRIAVAGLQENLIYAGAVSSEEMKEYYSVAEGLIMPSYAEGLSIAALEAIAYGLPVIMFTDSECADDLNDEEVACFARERSDSSLADAIYKWNEKKWDKNHIIAFSKYFTMERVADDYIAYYKRRIAEREPFI